VLLGSKVSTREHQDQRITALKLAELADGVRGVELIRSSPVLAYCPNDCRPGRADQTIFAVFSAIWLTCSATLVPADGGVKEIRHATS
jgi:hypothetical protein